MNKRKAKSLRVLWRAVKGKKEARQEGKEEAQGGSEAEAPQEFENQ